MKALLEMLNEERKRLEAALKIFMYSYETCRVIGLKNQYTYEELDKFEALTGRFARLSDLLIQKIWRLIDQIDLEDRGTIRDRIHRAEKKGLIDNAEVFVQIRIVRNDITHEYLSEAFQEIFIKVLELSPPLIEAAQKAHQYGERYGTS